MEEPNRNDGIDNEKWSQQSEANESERLSTLVMMDPDIDNRSTNPPSNDSVTNANIFQSAHHEGENLLGVETRSTGLAPMREEPTLKEKLVERERQRRVETERARLKRQFALSSNGGGAIDEDSTSGANDGFASRENGSVAGTVGEGSTVAQMDPYEGEGEKFNYPMERFLQEQGAVIEEEPPREKKRTVQNQGVVMERFLNEPIVVDAQQPHTSGDGPAVDRSVSFDMEPQATEANAGAVVVPAESTEVVDRNSTEPPVHSSMPSFHNNRDDYLTSPMGVATSITGNTSVANTSVDCVPSENAEIEDLGQASDTSEIAREEILRADSMDDSRLREQESLRVDPSVISEQPRFLRLTEAEIQEMAAIDDASRSNAPPSERDDISDSSFVGELVSDFGGQAADPAATLSQGTPTTAMESASIASGTHSVPHLSDTGDDHQSIQGSMSSNSGGSGAGASVTANPPSDIGANEVPPSPIPNEIHHVSNISEMLNQSDGGLMVETSENLETGVMMHGQEDRPLNADESAMLNAGVVNRRLRPGMVNLSQLRGLNSGRRSSDTPSTPLRRSLSVPDRMNFEVDDFDYDKNSPNTPNSRLSNELPANDLWSPGSIMSPSTPVQRRYLNDIDANDMMKMPTYNMVQKMSSSNGTPSRESESRLSAPTNETQPLLNKTQGDSPQEAQSNLDRIFGLMKPSNELDTRSNTRNQNLERMIALGVTALLEICVLMLVLTRTDHLCQQVGRTHYLLLIGFLPVLSAISGNFSLQTSNAIRVAACKGEVTSRNISSWLQQELKTAGLLGMVLGVCMGLAAFVLSKYSISIGLTIMFAQVTSIIAAALNGIFMPILLTFILKRDSTKWQGQAEATLQDIIASSAVVLLSYNIIMLGGSDVVEGNSCVI